MQIPKSWRNMLDIWKDPDQDRVRAMCVCVSDCTCVCVCVRVCVCGEKDIKKQGEKEERGTAKSEVVSQGGPGYNPTCGVLAGCNLSSELKHEKERKRPNEERFFWS